MDGNTENNPPKTHRPHAMTKHIQLKISRIKYTGDSIGDDIRVEIEVLSKFLRIDKKIKAGAAVDVNRDVGRFASDRRLFQADILITVIERDTLFNDVGSVKRVVSVDTAVTASQLFVFEVPVRETRSILRKFWGKATAVFEITLEATVTDAVRYLPHHDQGKGWLKVRVKDSKTIESLPAFLKVKLESSDGKREYFIPLEGTHRGKLVSAKLPDDGSSNLISGVEHQEMARASYSITKKTFTINGKAYATIDYKNAPWENGLYDIEIPDYPHALGARYEKDAPRAKTWFRMGHSGERYLHTGGRSLGCITIIETKRWVEIYHALIKARKGDRVSVGVLEVID